MTDDSLLVYTVEEAGRLLGVSRGSAYAAVRAGDIPAVRIGRRWLVPRHALLELVGANTAPDHPAEGGATCEPDHSPKASAGGRWA